MKKFVSVLIVCILILGIFPTAQANEYMNVYSLDGRVEVIRTADFYAWHAVGWYSAPVMYVYALDGRCELILKSDFSKWQSVGWYNAPMMYVYNPYGKKQLIRKDEFDYFHRMDWYSAPVMYVYARDGRKQLVLESEAPAWRAVGWDYQTSYADNIPWENDNQYWAVINLDYGPYRDWRMNRNYYIEKHFIEMPQSDRDNIKHYPWNNADANMYLVIPRYKTTNTIHKLYLNMDTRKQEELELIGTVYNGTPFTSGVIPVGDFEDFFRVKIYSNGNRQFDVQQNLIGLPGLDLEDEKVLDLTEWQYHSYY